MAHPAALRAGTRGAASRMTSTQSSGLALPRATFLTPGQLRPRVRAAAHEDSGSGSVPHPEVPADGKVDEDTLNFNVAHLGTLASRIEQIRQAQALHMLRHRYSPSMLEDAVEEGLASRPDMSVGAAELEAWHDAQWGTLKAAMDAGRDTPGSPRSE